MVRAYSAKMSEKNLALIDRNEELEAWLTGPLLTGTGVTVKRFSPENLGAVTDYPVIWLNYDLKDPTLTGLCRFFRDQKFSGPLLAFTGPFTETDKKQAFEAGLSEFFLKPFRLQNLIFRTGQIFASPDLLPKTRKIIIGPYLLENKELIHSDGSERLKLTDKEVDILLFLAKNSGEAVSRERLLTEVWAYNAKVTTHTLETHIYRLRQKIEPDPTNARFLCTTEKGYLLKNIFA